MEHFKLLMFPEHFRSKMIKIKPLKPNLGSGYHRQENPDLQEPPESAPAGMLVAILVALLAPENTLLIFRLLHELQVTEEMSADGRILSKTLPH